MPQKTIPRCVLGSECSQVPALGEVLEFMRLIWAVGHGLEARSKRMAAQLGVTGPQRLVLRIVGRCPGVAAGQVAEVLHLHPSTLTGVLRRLVERGVIVRRPGARDRREARFWLTTKGRALNRRYSGTVESAVRRVLAEAEPRTVAAASVLLNALQEELGIRREGK